MLEPGGDFRQSAGAVAELVFDFGAEFGKGQVVTGGDEERIISEAAVSTGGGDDGTLDPALEYSDDFTRPGEGERTAEAGWPGTVAEGGETFEKAGIVRRGIAVDSGIAGAVHARFAVEGIDFESGIVGQNPFRDEAGDGRSLQRSVFREGVPGFVNSGPCTGTVQSVNHKLRSENFPDFIELVEIARGKTQNRHAEIAGRSANDADFGAAVFGPGGFSTAGIGGHFLAEADGLDASAINTEADEFAADRLSAAFSEAAVVFIGAAFVGESGDDDIVGESAHGRGEGLDFAHFRPRDIIAVESEEDRGELGAVDVRAEEIGSINAVGEGGAQDVIPVNTGVLIAFLTVGAGGKGKQQDGEKEEAEQVNHSGATFSNLKKKAI